MRHVPHYLARALQRHPALLVDLLGLHNQLRSWIVAPRTRLVLGAVVLLGIAMVSVVFIGAREWLVAGLAWMVTYQVWTAVLMAIYAATLVIQRWRASERDIAMSWLMAAPNVAATLWSVKLWRTLWPLALQVSLLLACIGTLDWLELAPASIKQLTAWLLGGVSLGAAGGWCWARLRRDAAQHARYEDSRYAPRPRRERHVGASTHALTLLPIARALTWYRPENARMFFLVTVLLLPAGISAQAAAGALIILGLMSYAGTLARAVMQTGTQTAQWLRATPLRFAAFAWPLMRRAIVHQALVTMVIGALLSALGMNLGAVLYLALLWLTLVLMIWVLWLRGCYHSERVWLKAVGSVAGTLGLEQWTPRGFGMIFAVLWTAWHLRSRPA